MNALVKHVTEKDFMAAVVQFAKLSGWLVYHPYDSRRSPAGFPDLVLVRGPWILYVELKTERGKLSKEQEGWLAVLRRAGAVVRVWRPSNWPEIEEVLKRR